MGLFKRPARLALTSWDQLPTWLQEAPDEIVWAPFGVLDVKDDARGLRPPNLKEGFEKAARTLVLTSRRLVIVHQGEPRWFHDVPLGQVKKVGVLPSPLGPKHRVIRLQFPWGDEAGQWMVCQWSTRKAEAKAFVTQLLENTVAYVSDVRATAPSANGVLRGLRREVEYEGVVTALEEGLEFVGFLRKTGFSEVPLDADPEIVLRVPWQHIATIRRPAHEGTPSCLIFGFSASDVGEWGRFRQVEILDFMRPGEQPWLVFFSRRGLKL